MSSSSVPTPAGDGSGRKRQRRNSSFTLSVDKCHKLHGEADGGGIKRTGLAASFCQKINYFVKVNCYGLNPTEETKNAGLRGVFERTWTHHHGELKYYKIYDEDWFFRHIYKRICSLNGEVPNSALFAELQQLYGKQHVKEPVIRKRAQRTPSQNKRPRAVTTKVASSTLSFAPSVGNFLFTHGVRIEGDYVILEAMLPRPVTTSDRVPVVAAEDE